MNELISFAVKESRGNLHYEAPPKHRTVFQRDRDRIIHSSAFRRLEAKTQVFVVSKGDLFRTRLTHSLEVAQIGRAIAYRLGLNLDLVEAICLAHDLGHAPFGHSGQDILNYCLISSNYPGFEHNLQSLRIVDVLEKRYIDFAGLNLTYETREGILKHCSINNAKNLGELGTRIINKQNPSLEAQLANLADELAYNCHDVDDGLRSGLIKLDQLAEVPVIEKILDNYQNLDGRLLHKYLVRNLINRNINDAVNNSIANIEKYKITDFTDIAHAPSIIAYSEEIYQEQRQLKKFLHKNLYRHPEIVAVRFKSDNIIKSLFDAYINNPQLIPANFQKTEHYLAVADYISGMTDRYACEQYNKLFTV